MDTNKFEVIKVNLSGNHYQPGGYSVARVTDILWDKENNRPCIHLVYENGKSDYIPLSELGQSHVLGSVTIVNSL